MSAILITNSWPDDLPLPFVDYTGTARTTTLVSDVGSGNIHRRSRSRKTYARLAATWKMGTTEKRAFETFYETDLGCGVALFAIDLRVNKNSALTTWAARFGDAGYEIIYQEGVWQVTAALELIVPTLLSIPTVDPNVGYEEFMMGTDASSGEVSLTTATSDGEIFYVLE